MPSKKRQLNIRPPQTTFDAIERLSVALECSQTDVVVRAVRELAARQKAALDAIPKKTFAKPLD